MALSRGLADTSVFVAQESGRLIHEEALPEELAVSVITSGELRAGVFAATDVLTRNQRLATLAVALSLEPVPIDESVADKWARLRTLLRDRGLSMPFNDSWIAATAMALDVPVVTQDNDFAVVGGLRVIRV